VAKETWLQLKYYKFTSTPLREMQLVALKQHFPPTLRSSKFI